MDALAALELKIQREAAQLAADRKAAKEVEAARSFEEKRELEKAREIEEAKRRKLRKQRNQRIAAAKAKTEAEVRIIPAHHEIIFQRAIPDCGLFDGDPELVYTLVHVPL